MATRLSAQQLVTEALRVVGELSARDTAPRQNVMEIGLLWLDIVVSDLCATEDIKWMVPDVVVFNLKAGKWEYAFGSDDTPSSRPETGVEFVSSIMIVDSSGYRAPITIRPYTEFKQLERLEDTGVPAIAAINRRDNAILFNAMYAATDPDSDAEETGYIAEVVVQSFSPDLYTKGNQSKTFDLGAAWNQWAILATAYAISGGPVRRLPKGDRDQIRTDREEAKRRLLAIENKTTGKQNRVRFRMPM